MKAVFLAGGLGSRITEESQYRPKPMIEVGGKPVLWHLLKYYSEHNIQDFIICCGYKGYFIKEYFANHLYRYSDITFDLAKDKFTIHSQNTEPWKVTLVDTGKNTITGGRLKRVKNYLGKKDFCFTYGDGLSDINIKDLIKFHKSQKTLATVTSIQPPNRFGVLSISKKKFVTRFKEKPVSNTLNVNGGFFVLSPKVLDYIESDNTVWEKEPLEKLASKGQLAAFEHEGFWQSMDTLRDKIYLESLWESGKAPWKRW